MFLLGESHGQRSLMGYSPKGHKKLDITNDYTHTHTHTQGYEGGREVILLGL